MGEARRLFESYLLTVDSATTDFLSSLSEHRKSDYGFDSDSPSIPLDDYLGRVRCGAEQFLHRFRGEANHTERLKYFLIEQTKST